MNNRGIFRQHWTKLKN